MAIRAVYHELESLIESVLQNAALQEFEARQIKKVKENRQLLEKHQRSMLERGTPPAEVMRIFSTQVEDARFKQLKTLVEDHLGISLGELPGAKMVERVHEVANDLKHRGGKFDTRNRRRHGLADQHKLTVARAQEAINKVERFVRALGRSVNAAQHGLQPGGGRREQ